MDIAAGVDPAPVGSDGPLGAQEVSEMTREADVVRSLVEMADTLVDDYDVVDLLTGLADRCVSLLGVSAAGVMLASPAGGLGLVASSSEAMRLLELFELQEQEGPRPDAFRTRELVGDEDLAGGVGPSGPSSSLAALTGRVLVSVVRPWRGMRRNPLAPGSRSVLCGADGRRRTSLSPWPSLDPGDPA